MGLNNCIKFAGYITEEMKPIFLKSGDIFVLPSTVSVEVFPVALLEASAAGLPLIVSDLHAFSCIVDNGYNGLVVKRKDVNDLASAIISSLKDPLYQNYLSSNSLLKGKEFSWDKIASETNMVYEKLFYESSFR